MLHMTKEEENAYYVAKEIAEEFDWQINYKLSEKNENRQDGELWSECDNIVTFNLKKGRIEIETIYFNEFDEKHTKYSFFGEFRTKYCRTVKEFGRVIGMYFQYFQNDFPCSFTTSDY